MATFGKTDTEGSTYGGPAGGVFACRYYLSEDAIALPEIWAYIAKQGPGVALARCSIYSDLNGVPDSRIAVTEEGEIPYTTLSWVRFPFATPFGLTRGYYWLAINVNSAYYYVRDVGVANQQYFKWSAYPTFPDPFGAADSKLASKYTIYAVYTPVTPPPPGTLQVHAYVG